MRTLAIAIVVVLAQGIAGAEQGRHGAARPSIEASVEESLIVAGGDLRWTAAPPSLPPGAQAAVLDGNPATPDRLFAMRLRVPAGYRIMPHWHPADEHVTVISGSVRIGEGKTPRREAMTTLRAGGYFVMPARHVHAFEASSDAVIQIHGVGPWAIHYVNPADDPRRERRPEQAAR